MVCFSALQCEYSTNDDGNCKFADDKLSHRILTLRKNKGLEMTVNQSKSRTTTIIDVIGRPGGKKGRLELTSGNVNYFRAGAKAETLSLTYQQLMAVLERELEFQSINPITVKLPKPHTEGDFTLNVGEWNEINGSSDLFSARSSINKLEPRFVAIGTCQFRAETAQGRRLKNYGWCAEVSIQAALWMINCYIDKFLAKKKMSSHTDEEVVVSKQKMREVLLMLFKKIES